MIHRVAPSPTELTYVSDWLIYLCQWHIESTADRSKVGIYNLFRL
ncbi:MAG: hypothetical protein UHM85_01700 [Acutalibacteraceae bacterium]|nr:hypothetical protein [Acutalibacteraceae bacterium]